MKSVLIFASGLFIGHAMGTLYGAALYRDRQPRPGEPGYFLSGEG